MNNKNLVKAIGFIATVIGMGVTLVSNWVQEKTMDSMIEEKISKALANDDEETNEDEDEES